MAAQGFWARMFGSGAEKAGDSVLHELVESVVETADPRIRRVRGYRGRLVPAVERALEYCALLVAGLPGPVALGPATYHRDPLVKALFTSAQQVEEFLAATLAREEVHGDPDGATGHGLLTMTRTERTVYGHARQDEMLVGDVARKTVNFIDHRLVALACSLDLTREILARRGVEFLATAAMEKITALRTEVAELRENKSHLQSMKHILAGRDRSAGMFARPSYETRRKIEEVRTELERVEEELQQAHARIARPEDSLDLLCDYLENPQPHLRSRLETLRLDWMNALVKEIKNGESHDITLAELSADNDVQRWAVLVSFDLPAS
jgi:hypothetical protein